MTLTSNIIFTGKLTASRLCILERRIPRFVALALIAAPVLSLLGKVVWKIQSQQREIGYVELWARSIAIP